MIDQSINDMIKMTKATCDTWIKEDKNGDKIIVDPIELKPIYAHYAMSHCAAAYILIGIMERKPEDIETGLQLTKGILNRWNEDQLENAFHFDFNNFALCIIHEALTKLNEKEIYQDLIKKIETVIVNTGDSRHFTVNWLPMRIFVNLKRYEMTLDNRYMQTVGKLEKMIQKATYQDGHIDDLLPKGQSFNLQYNIATVAVLEFLNRRGRKYNVDFSLTALLNCVLPDGDINYLGRGCNQIFAWGLWIYLLKMKNQENTLNIGLDYLFQHLPQMLENNNIMLNKFEGKERFLWWDYHYCSVYTAHFLLWMILSRYDTANMEPLLDCYSDRNDSGLIKFRQTEFVAILFKGRKEYLAEKGPVITGLWVKDMGIICKGSFGPWNGRFGNMFLESTNVIRNYVGPIKTERKVISELFYLLFPEIKIDYCNKALKIVFSLKREEDCFFNLPILNSEICIKNIKLYADNEPINLCFTGNLKNQYGLASVYQSKIIKAKIWKLIFI